MARVQACALGFDLDAMPPANRWIDVCSPLPANAGERVVKTKLLIPATLALALTCLHHSVAFAWGPGGGAPGIPGFSALWDEPKPKAIGQATKKRWSGDPATRRSGKAKKKAWGSVGPAPGPYSR